jgi:hypothetical protein
VDIILWWLLELGQTKSPLTREANLEQVCGSNHGALDKHWYVFIGRMAGLLVVVPKSSHSFLFRPTCMWYPMLYAETMHNAIMPPVMALLRPRTYCIGFLRQPRALPSNQIILTLRTCIAYCGLLW